MSPREAFLNEKLADETALHANALDPMEVVHQPIQRPGRVLFPQIARLRGPSG